MNLASQMEQEMSALQLYQPFDIARYLYIRTGQMFEYHPFYSYADKEMQDGINQEKKDIFCIQDFYVTCFSWSQVYVDLLSYFGIFAYKVVSNDHCRVVIELNGEMILADLMTASFDFYRTKIGLNTRDYVSKMPDFKLQLWETDRKITPYPSIRMEAVFAMIRKELAKRSQNDDELLCNSFDAISLLMEYFSLGHVTGKKFLYATMNFFADNLYSEYGGTGTFYDISKQERVDIFSCYMPSDVTKQRFYRFEDKDGAGLKLVRTHKKEVKDYYHSLKTDQTDYFRTLLF